MASAGGPRGELVLGGVERFLAVLHSESLDSRQQRAAASVAG